MEWKFNLPKIFSNLKKKNSTMFDFWTKTVESALLDHNTTICEHWLPWLLVALYTFFQQMNKIKADNTRLREENRALTRVISKLSK